MEMMQNSSDVILHYCTFSVIGCTCENPRTMELKSLHNSGNDQSCSEAMKSVLEKNCEVFKCDFYNTVRLWKLSGVAEDLG